MKKLLAFILILALAISCVSMVTFTVSAATYGDLTYTVSNGKVTITDCDTSVSGTLEIPATIDGYPVTSIGSSAFEGCSSLTSVTIPDGVTRIGSYAFQNCSSLTSITIGNGVTSIGYDAFSGCSSLTSITIPDSVTSIGDEAFQNCSSLTSITIPDSVTSIGRYAFYYCSNLTSITIPDSVTRIGDSAFSGCSSLTSVTIPNSVTSIDEDAFWGCSSLASITIPDSVTSISDSAFRNCSSLKSITIPDSVTSIGYSAFNGCSSLTSVTIPDSVTRISDSAFEKCSSLTSITIPDSVTSIGNSAFNGCSSLKEVHITDLKAWCKISFGNYTSNPVCYAKKLYLNGTSITNVVIPEGVTRIGKYAFSGCSSLTSITIPDSVTSIGDYAFQNCSSLTSITIPDSVTSIGTSAFNGCSGLTSITIPDSVTSIGGSAFNNCSGLTSITIPDSVTSIGDNAFEECSSLKEVHITDLKAWCNIKFSNYLSNPLYHAHNLYLNGELVTDLIVPDGITSIGSRAFEYCSSLTSITIPDSVTSIDSYAFYNCSSLTSITIPDSVTSISNGAFYGCSRLTSITIPDSVTSIGGSAFQNCSRLTSVTIGNSVTSIGYGAFEGCSKLSTIYYNGTDEQWNNITVGSNNTPLLNARLENSIAYVTYEISNNEVTITDFDTTKGGIIELPATIEGYPVTKIGASAFAGCTLITEIILPDSITEIGASAFEECNLITEIVIPDSVTEIGAWAFYNCSALTEINIPASVTKINSYTFNNCSALTDVWFDGTEEQWASVTISSGNTPLKNAKVYYNFDGHKDITKYLTYRISSGKVTITDCDTSIAGAYFIPDTIEGYPVTSIVNSAFYGCSSITSITIPDSVTSIGPYAFWNCSSLTSIAIPDNVTRIDSNTFSGCSSLTSITIPDSVTSIGMDAFQNCYSLKDVHITDLRAWCNIKLFDSSSNPLGFAQNLYLNGELVTDLIVPDGVTSISSYAFQGCNSLTSITIPDSVTSIGGSAFLGCSSLTSITISDSVTSIGGSAFRGCSSLTSITIPDSVTSIGNYTFQNCSSLTSVTIPDSVTSIGDSAFNGCSSLETVYYPATKAKWNNITIGGNNEALTNAELICIDPQITGSSVDVGSTLTVNYFVEFNYLDKFNLTADDFTMRFTSPNGKVELVKGTYDPQSGYYKYPYAGVNPQCMNDNIKAELIYNEEVFAIKEYYSVKEYCERQVSRTAEQLGLTETQYNALKTLLADMLVYGSEAQKYKDYNVSELPDVDEWVSEYKSTFTAPNGVKKVTGNADAENKVKSVGLNMANVNRIYFKMILNDENVVIKLNDKVIDRAELIKNADGTFTLYSSDIKATGFDNVHTLTLTQGEEVISTVQYNVNAYVKSKNADENVGDIVKALSNYGTSAKRYANSFKTIGDNQFELEEDIL